MGLTPSYRLFVMHQSTMQLRLFAARVRGLFSQSLNSRVSNRSSWHGCIWVNQMRWLSANRVLVQAAWQCDLHRSFGIDYPRVGVSSEGIAVVLCVCVNVFCSGCCYFLSAYSRDCRPSQLLQKLFPLDKRLLSSSWKRQKLVVCRKVLFKC